MFDYTYMMKNFLTLLCFLMTLTSFCQIEISNPDELIANVPPPDTKVTPFTLAFDLTVDAAASPSGEELAVATLHNVLVYRIREGIISGGFSYQYPEQVPKQRTLRPAKVILFAPDDKSIITLNNNGTVQVRDKRTGRIFKTIAIPDHVITALGYNEKRDCLLVGTDKGQVQLYNTSNYSFLKQYDASAYAIYSLAATDEMILVGSTAGKLIGIDIAYGKLKEFPRKASEDVHYIDISSDGKYAVYTATHYVYLQNLTNDECKFISGTSTIQTYRASFTPDDSLILVADMYTIWGYDLRGKHTTEVSRQLLAGFFFEFIPNTNLMAKLTGNSDQGSDYIDILETGNYKLKAQIGNTNAAVEQLVMSPGKDQLYVAQYKGFKTIDLKSGKFTRLPSTTQTVLSQDAKSLVLGGVTATGSPEIRILDPVTQTLLYKTEVFKHDYRLSNDGKHIGHTLYEPSGQVFGVDNLEGKELYRLPFWKDGYYQSVEFTPTPGVVLHRGSTREPDRMRLVNLADTTQQLLFKNAVRLTYEGQHMLAFDENTHKMIWVNTKTFQTNRELPLKERPEFVVFNNNKIEVALLDIHKQGKLVECRIAIYDIKTLKPLRQLHFDPYLMPDITSLLWSPNDKTFVLGSGNGLIEFRDAKTGASKGMLFIERGGENYVAIDNELRWTGTTDALSYMTLVEKKGVPISLKELNKKRDDMLFKKLLLD